MAQVTDPLRALRPLREEDVEQLAITHETSASPLAYDVYRIGDELVIDFDAAGVAPSTIEVAVEGHAVVVSLRRELAHGPGVDLIESGRQHGTFRQRLWLGERWDVHGLRAHAENGVLSVRAPLVADTGSRRVEVATSGQADQRPTGPGARRDAPELDVVAAVHSAA